jgi:O-antigen ligase
MKAMFLPAIGIGAWAALAALAPGPWMPFVIAAPVVAIPLAWWMLQRADRWVAAFLGAALLLPPLPVAIGNTGPHPALLFAAAGGWIGAMRLRQWRIGRLDPVGRAMLIFLAVLLASIAPATLYSGEAIAVSTFARVLLFAISVYLYLYTVHGPDRGAARDRTRLIRLLMLVAAAVATFACLDFYFQFPAPAGYGAQFVWLDAGILRRAQGFFYEASTLGNCCAFFLVMIASVVAAGRENGVRSGSDPIFRILMMSAGILLSAALVFSYSRASIVALVCALLALFYLRRKHTKLGRLLLFLPLALAAGSALVYFVFPEFAQSYLIRARASFEFFFDEPNKILSGRLASWRVVADLLADNPLYLLFGIGYKTLPYTDLAGGSPLVADNMYLSLLIETGIPGLIAFLCLNVTILIQSHNAAARGSIFGIWIFCFWIGEMVQMLSGDLFTYWRVLPLYFWILALAVTDNPHERSVS